MRLADQSRMIPLNRMANYGYTGNAEEIPVFIDWLRQRRAEGRIKDDHVGHMDELITRLEERQEQLK